MKKSIVTGKGLANHFGITSRRVEQLCAAGVFPRVSRGKYDQDVCTKKYIKHLKEWKSAAVVPASGNDLQRCFDVSSSTIFELVTAGIIPKLGHGHFDLIACCRAYIKHIQRDGQLSFLEAPTIAKKEKEHTS